MKENILYILIVVMIASIVMISVVHESHVNSNVGEANAVEQPHAQVDNQTNSTLSTSKSYAAGEVINERYNVHMTQFL